MNKSTSASTPSSNSRLTRGMKICPSCVSEVWTISMRGNSPSWIACATSEKAPVMTAWLAMTVAAVDNSISGASAQAGASR